MSDNPQASNASVFDRYANNTPQDNTPQQDYKAFGLDKSKQSQSRLMVHYKNGMMELISYAHLTNALCTSAQYISLICSNCVITLEGQNLLSPVVEEINAMELLQDEKIRTIRCFNGAAFSEPSGNEPVIHNIRRVSLEQWQQEQGGET